MGYKAFILAAGFGTRLRPYTETVPKPMVEVAGRSLIYRTLDKLRAVNIDYVVVNTHYLPDVMVQHLDEYVAQHNDIEIHVSHENTILDTGGGIVKALQHFGDEPFYVIAGDNLWEDGDLSALTRLAQSWDDAKMDVLTLMQPVSNMVLTKGVGDYKFVDDAQVERSLDQLGTHMWTNIRLNHPRLYKDQKAEAFSFLPLMDGAQEQGRLCALEHDGEWHHISTPNDLETVDLQYKKASS